ncbi:hypothetical protein ACFQY0_16155 [Haloferula chungangensis]|uniref:DUF4394 domain-containing protein n=1 Tax=Haloferula chungangensis TaxID=1048331 RepID=A0ABW2L8J0_9BACT
MKLHSVLTFAALLAGGNFSQAQTIIYSQDFSASSPVDGSGIPATIEDGILYASSSQSITGGDSGAQATNGDYAIALGRISGADDGYIFNADPSYVPVGQNGTEDFFPSAGFAGIDQNYVFTSGIITIDDQGTPRTGTVSINANAFNVGGEYLSLNLIRIEEDDATGEVVLIIDYDAFGDFDGNENPTITTNFGVSGDLTAYNFFDAAEAANSIGANNGFAEVLTFTLVEAFPEIPTLSSIVYSQDFKASSPVDGSGTVSPIEDGLLYDSSGQTISGGDSLNQESNGEYTIDLLRPSMSVPFDPGDPDAEPPVPPTPADQNGFIFNGDPGFVPDGGSIAPFSGFVRTGFAAIDQNYTFTSGPITIDDNGTPRTGTVSITATLFNVGGEFLNLGLVEVGEDANGDPTLIIAYDSFGDFHPGDPDAEPPIVIGNESILVTTNFGGIGDLTSFDISPDTLNNSTTEGVFVHNLVSLPEELVIIDVGFTPSGDFFILLDSDATGSTVSVSTDLSSDSFSPIEATTEGALITVAEGDLPADSAFFRVSR